MGGGWVRRGEGGRERWVRRRRLDFFFFGRAIVVRLLLSLFLARSLSFSLTPNANTPSRRSWGNPLRGPFARSPRSPPRSIISRRRALDARAGRSRLRRAKKAEDHRGRCVFFFGDEQQKKALVRSFVSRSAVRPSSLKKIQDGEPLFCLPPRPTTPFKKQKHNAHLAGAQVLGLGLGEHHGLDGALGEALKDRLDDERATRRR